MRLASYVKSLNEDVLIRRVAERMFAWTEEFPDWTLGELYAEAHRQASVLGVPDFVRDGVVEIVVNYFLDDREGTLVDG